MKNLLQKLEILKTELKEQSKELKDKLLEDSQYEEFYEDLKASKEVLTSYRKKMLEENEELSLMADKIKDKKDEIKTLKAVIMGRIRIVDSESGEQLSFDFNF